MLCLHLLSTYLLLLRFVWYVQTWNVADYSLFVLRESLWDIDKFIEECEVGVGVLGSREEQGIEVHGRGVVNEMIFFNLKYNL